MSIEDHLLDLVKGAKAMTESMVKTVEKVVEEIRKDKPAAAEEVKVNKGSVYTVKDCPGQFFRYREKIYRKQAGCLLPNRVCGVMGSEYECGVWARSVSDDVGFLFLEGTEVTAVV